MIVMEETISCIVCHDQITGAAVTRCGHRFCRHCLEQWLERTPTCPLCRHTIERNELVNDPNFDELTTLMQEDTQSTTSDKRMRETFARVCRCYVCTNTLDGANLTKCGHRFCAHCIRHYLEQTNRCPYCRQALEDTELIPDPNFDALTAQLKRQIEESQIATMTIENQAATMLTRAKASLNDGNRDIEDRPASVYANKDADTRAKSQVDEIALHGKPKSRRMTRDSIRLGPTNRAGFNQGHAATARVGNTSILTARLPGNHTWRNQSEQRRNPLLNTIQTPRPTEHYSLQANTAGGNLANRNLSVLNSNINRYGLNTMSQANTLERNQSQNNMTAQVNNSQRNETNTNNQSCCTSEVDMPCDLRIGMALSAMAIVTGILSTALPYWDTFSDDSHYVIRGLWKVCLKYDCFKFENPPVCLQTIQAFSVIGVLILTFGAFFGRMYARTRPKYLIISVLTALISGVLFALTVIIFSACGHLADYSLGSAFYLGIVTTVLTLPAAWYIFRSRRDARYNPLS